MVMNKHRVNAWVKRAIRKQLQADTGNHALNQYQPGLSENLETEYGMNAAMRHGSHAYINAEFSNADEPEPIVPPLLGHETKAKKTAGGMAGIVKKRFGLGILLALVLVGWNTGSAKAAFHLQDFDTDGNPEAVSYQELRLFLTYNLNMSIAEFDAAGNQNGVLDGAEVDAYNRVLDANIDDALGAFFYSDEEDRILTSGKTVPLDTVLGNFNLKRKNAPKPLTPEEIAEKEKAARLAKTRRFVRDNHRLYIRGSGKDVSIRESALDAAGAKVTYTNNNVTDIDVGRIKGAVGYLFSGTLKPGKAKSGGGPVLDSYSYGGSIELDRFFDSRGRAFEKDALTLRLGGDLQFSGIMPGNIPTQYLTNWVRYQTDTRFEEQTYGLETIYEPYIGAFNRLYSLDNNLKLIARFTPTLRSDYTIVGKDPNSRFLVDRFWNLGFGASFRLDLTDDDKTLAYFTTTYENYWDVLGGIGRTYSWENQLSFPLARDSGLDVALTATHTLSRKAATGKRDDRFELGLGVKF
ncbi:hypothetical protein [Hoeflea sp.]|uniref:hypothetical protein n=1 Tax=Hoeflea sp. TaxID=1940281 RepID=UPI003A9011F2